MTPPSWPEQLNPRIIRCWRGRWPPGSVEPARYLYEHELVVVTEGICTVRVEKTAHRLSAGEFIIIPPAKHHITTTADDGVCRSCIHFDWMHLPDRPATPICCFLPDRPDPNRIIHPPAWAQHPLPPGSFARQGPVPGIVDQLFKRWAGEDPVEAATSRSLMQELLLRLLWSQSGAQPAPQDRATHLAYLVKDLLDSHIDKPASVRTLIAGLSFTYEHLCRIFHAKFSITPLSYLNARRLERARTQLPNPRLTIAEIAFANGFQDAGYFTR
ncbi:MAG: helix-turn-helix domain-containing protein, partial [Candidatus Methylacidiphilales bacterium]|nr:AraC family transcriptional regulator [Candidatus Methylacidiphilales bacterium]